MEPVATQVEALLALMEPSTAGMLPPAAQKGLISAEAGAK